MLGQRSIPSLVQCWSFVYDISKQMEYTQCRFNIDPQSLTLAQHWNRIGWLSLVCSDCYASDTFLLCHQKGHFPDNTIYFDPMLGHRLRRSANINPTKTFQILITNIIENIFFSEHFWNTQVLNLIGSWPLAGLIIRMCSQVIQVTLGSHSD